ncbi:MAG: hypothetical protein M8357_10455 [Desulfobulbaceae bacterium]|nr:hypothetical protein [Desulfobulbaceae bacterium]
MKGNPLHRVLPQIIFMAALTWPFPVWGFYAHTGSRHDINVTGSFAAGAGLAKYPEAPFLYDEGSEASWYGDLRLLAEASLGEQFGVRLNVLENVRSTPVFVPTQTDGAKSDVQRSGLLYSRQHDSTNTQAAMVLDSGYLKYIDGKNELAVGRQPVSTTVTFYFTPNDFFAPFSPNTFYRVYKPGVDALRYERRIAALSQLSVIGVLGYEEQADADSGWSNSPDWHRSSLLARFTHTAGEFEWGLLSGIVRESMVTGFSLQGELFQWLGVRTEGHYANTWADDRDSGLMATISFEHRFPSSLNLRLEQMYNGYGEDSIAEALAEKTRGATGPGYLGRHYSAFDVSYQLSPLLVGEMLFLRNWSDHSYSVSFNAVYSTSDESELAVTAVFPGGSKPGEDTIRSELGSLPVQFSLEYRHYF